MSHPTPSLLIVWNLGFSLEALEEPTVGQILAHTAHGCILLWIPTSTLRSYPQEELGTGGVGCPGRPQVDMIDILQLYFGFPTEIIALRLSRERPARSWVSASSLACLLVVRDL